MLLWMCAVCYHLALAHMAFRKSGEKKWQQSASSSNAIMFHHGNNEKNYPDLDRNEQKHYVNKDTTVWL